LKIGLFSSFTSSMATSAAASDIGLGTPEPPTLLGALSPSPSGCEEDIHRLYSKLSYIPYELFSYEYKISF
jgi:hypothetical protein